MFLRISLKRRQRSGPTPPPRLRCTLHIPRWVNRVAFGGGGTGFISVVPQKADLNLAASGGSLLRPLGIFVIGGRGRFPVCKSRVKARGLRLGQNAERRSIVLT
jgi:hypothetical protein